MTTVKDIFAYLDIIAPFATQMEHDNSGLLVGDGSARVETVLLALDVTESVLAQAERAKAQLILTHHPVIFKARRQLLAGDLAYELALRGIACIAWHTPLDATAGGVNDVLAGMLGLKDLAPLVMQGQAVAYARAGTVEPTDAAGFAALAAERLGARVRFCDAGRTITRVAICGGAGGFLLPTLVAAQSDGAASVDAFLTGDANHHDFLDARQAGLSLFAAGHYETEFPVIPALAERLRAAFPAIHFIISEEPCPVKTTPIQ